LVTTNIDQNNLADMFKDGINFVSNEGLNIFM